MYRGTTPTISFTLPFRASNLAAAFISIEQNHSVVIEKSINECELNGVTISAKLSQEDTLKLTDRGTATVQLRGRMMDGNAVATEKYSITVGSISKDGVI